MAEKKTGSRQFILRADGRYALPSGYKFIRVLSSEEHIHGNGTETHYVYTLLVEEVAE